MRHLWESVCLSEPQPTPSLLQSPPPALRTETWSFHLEAHAQDPAVATGTLMAEDQVSLGFLFPKMILRPPQRAILISACGPKSFRPS